MKKIQFSFQTEWLSWLMIAAVVALSIWAYPHLPALVPSHWGISGQIDGWTPRLAYVLMMSGMMLGFYLLFLALPYLEPRREHFHQSAVFYHMIRNVLMVFFAGIYGVTLWAGLTGEPVAVDKIIPVAIGLLFILIGHYLPQIKSNFFMGIRTPWTLSSEENWHRTHLLGSYTFVIAGALFVLSPFLPVPLNFYLPMTGIIIAGFIPILMSFIWFKQEKK